MSFNDLFYQRIAKALRRKRIPTDKERQKEAAKRGGFDETFINKEALKRIEQTHSHCYWCKEDSLKAVADETHKTGNIEMQCTTPGCPNNPDTTKVELNPTMKNKYARFIDGELCFTFAKLLQGRDPGRLAATKQGIVL